MCSAAILTSPACSFNTAGGGGGGDGTSGDVDDGSTTSDTNPSTTLLPTAGTSTTATTTSSTTSQTGSTTSSTTGSTTADASTGEPTTEGPTTEPTTDTTATTDESTTSTSGSTSSSESGDDSTTATVCPGEPLVEEVLLAQDLPGSAINQMTERTSALLPNFDSFYYSLGEGVGDITFTFDVACETEVYVWLLAYDWNVSQDNADSFYYAFDADAAVAGDYTEYSCGPEDDIGWQWRRLRRLTSDACNQEDVVPTLGAGAHTLNLLNREEGELDEGEATFDFAGVAGIAIGSSPAYDPNDDYPL